MAISKVCCLRISVGQATSEKNHASVQLTQKQIGGLGMLTERFLWERPVTELILEKALHKAKLPFKSNVFIGRYEVDFLVGSLIAVEVDGYVH